MPLEHDVIVLQPTLTVPDVAVPIPTSLSLIIESEINAGETFYLASIFAEAGESLPQMVFP